MAPPKESAASTGLCNGHSGIEARLTNVEKDTADQWATINRIRNRPPVWTTVVISLLTFMLGASLTYAALVVKVAAVAKAATP